MPFVSAHDPRVVTAFKQVRFTIAADSLYDQRKYLSSNDPIVVASGIEARLTEAEAALHEPNPTKMVAILDTLRQSIGMTTIDTAPSTTAAQVDLLYRERAFWLYLTGRRLGDMRRLIRNYARDPETVFPSGPYPLSGASYGTATAIPFTLSVQSKYNPHITTGCTTR